MLAFDIMTTFFMNVPAKVECFSGSTKHNTRNTIIYSKMENWNKASFHLLGKEI